MDYTDKSKIMEILFKDYTVRGNEYRCKYKNVPIELYEKYKQFIDFTAFYGVFRGKRNFSKGLNRKTGNMVKYYESSTRKVNAERVDIYPHYDSAVVHNRLERETFLKAKKYFTGV